MSVTSMQEVTAAPDPASLRDEIIAVGRRWSNAQHRLLELVVALDVSGQWAADGAPSCARWIADTLDIEVCTAREWLRIGRRLTELPTIGTAFVDGRISYSKVRTLTRVATPENEVELEEIAEHVPAGRLAHALATWLTAHESPEETEARHFAARTLSVRLDPDGLLAGFFRLPPADGKAILQTIDNEVQQHEPRLGTSADASSRWPTVAQQRADAFVRRMTTGGSGLVTELVINVRGDGCTFEDGTPISDTFVERIAPSSFLRALIHDAERRPINASGRHRHPTQRQQRVVAARDRACVDCGATEFLEFDHEPSFEKSGRTVVDELRWRCRSCHRRRHALNAARRSRGVGRS